MHYVFRSAAGNINIPLSVRRLPLVPELALWLMPDVLPEVGVDPAVRQGMIDAPPYWAWCWGGGQALARYVLDYPHHVAGRRVIDFGCGSGVVACAALMAGAAEVIAVDIDPACAGVVTANARLNGLLAPRFSDVIEVRTGDMVMAADVCYEASGRAWVDAWAAAGAQMLLAESRVHPDTLALPGSQRVATLTVRTFPDLGESNRFDGVHIIGAGF